MHRSGMVTFDIHSQQPHSYWGDDYHFNVLITNKENRIILPNPSIVDGGGWWQSKQHGKDNDLMLDSAGRTIEVSVYTLITTGLSPIWIEPNLRHTV